MYNWFISIYENKTTQMAIILSNQLVAYLPFIGQYYRFSGLKLSVVKNAEKRICRNRKCIFTLIQAERKVLGWLDSVTKPTQCDIDN